MRFSFRAPHHKRRALQTVVTSEANIPDVRVPDCRRSLDGWAEETPRWATPQQGVGSPRQLPARDLAPEMHLHRREHLRWWKLRGSWILQRLCHHLSHSFIFCLSFLFLPLPRCLFLQEEQSCTNCIRRERVIIVTKSDLPTFHFSQKVSWLCRANNRRNYDSEFMLLWWLF